MGNAADRAHEAIRAGILDGVHAPGAMLSENALAAALGMSRTPVRSALARLGDEGWVRVYPQRGALVTSVDADEAHDLTHALQAIELAGIRDATMEQRGATIARLRTDLAAHRAASAAGDADGARARSTAFHRVLAQAAGNRFLDELYDRLHDRRTLLNRQSAGAIAARADRIADEHEALLDLAESGDWEAFATALRAHVDDAHGAVDRA